MKTTQKLKQDIFKQIKASGMFKQIQSKLKTQVLTMVQKQSNQNKKQIGFQYQHPLLNKLRKYPLTSFCLDLIQQFLESFKFKYTLSVFKKQINRDQNINRIALANNFKIQMKNVQSQAILLSIVAQLVSGDIKIDTNKHNNNLFSNNNNNSYDQQNNNLRINNFLGNNQNKNINNSDSNLSSNFSKKSAQQSINSYSQINNNTTSNKSIQQKSSLNELSQIPSSSNSDLKSSKQISKENIKKQPQSKKQQPVQQDQKTKKKKKKQVQKPPQGATDLMGDLMSKFKTKDMKNQKQKKDQIFEQKRAFSQQKVKKVVDPSQSGTNQIRGVSAGKIPSVFLSKFMPAATINQPKNQSFIQQDIDQLQQSKDSTRKNPLFSSTQSGFDKSGYYDKSVDSNAIDDFQYVEKAKKFTKKY